MSTPFHVAKTTEIWFKHHEIQAELFEQTISTNDLAKDEAFHVKENKIYLADQQSGGRGRGKNTWHNCNEGDALIISWSFPMKLAPQHITSPLFGLALFQTLKKTFPQLEWSLKAPNDIYLGDKKMGGLLVESLNQGGPSWLIVGLGLNIHSHPKELESEATHLCHSDSGLGEKLSEELWDQFLEALQSEFQEAKEKSIQTQITEPDREALTRALNSNPNKKELILDVSGDGDLILDKETIPWTRI